MVPREARDFGKYELVAKLATGGMAEIFLARRTDPVGRGDLVVIKRILPHLAEDEHFVTMFRDEANLASRLEHPNVCRVFTLGKNAGTWYIVMEYLHGVALSRMLTRLARARATVDLRIAAGIVVQACEGLNHAHDLRAEDGSLLGVVHRDVSPPNIFLGADGTVKLLDFGIAKARGASSKTRTGTVKGKNAYMSPEQILGRPLDRRSDVFALGAVMYELVTVKRLFHRDSDFLTFKAITEEPIPNVKERRPDLPTGLREVIHRALARDIGARYLSARDMADAVTAAMAPLGGPATPAELGALVQADFADELNAKQQLWQKAATAPIAADSSTVPMLSASSSARIEVAATAVAKPPRGNTLSALEGELVTPPPRPLPRPTRGTQPPPIPGAALAAVVAAPPPPVPTNGEPAFGLSGAPDLSADLLGSRRRKLVLRLGIGLAGTIVLIAVWIAVGSGGKTRAVAAIPDAGPGEVVMPAEPRRTIDEARDAGESKEEIAARSRFGYFTIGVDEDTIIYIDGNLVGKITPDKPLDRWPLKPGPHKVRAVGPKKKEKTFPIDIFGGQETNRGTIVW
jgi:eukaryotic-like serine/threonine-protein kinase